MSSDQQRQRRFKSLARDEFFDFGSPAKNFGCCFYSAGKLYKQRTELTS